jgi:hypothetical protein
VSETINPAGNPLIRQTRNVPKDYTREDFIRDLTTVAPPKDGEQRGDDQEKA